MFRKQSHETGGPTPSKSAFRSVLQAAKLPLPGFSELENTIKAVVDSFKTSGYNDDQCASLAMQLGRLSLIVGDFDVTQHPEILEISSHLGMIKDQFEQENKSRSRSGIPNAERRLQTLANIRQEINDFINNAQLRMLLKIRESNAKPVTIDKVLVIPEHEIVNQVLMYEGPCEAGDLYYIRQRRKLLGNGNQDNSAVVRVNTRRGRYGNLPVIYKTYSSHSSSDDAASRAAENHLKCISRVLHPNVANLVGITQGYYGINGIVVTARGIPYFDFLLQVSSGATLTRCMRGILAACEVVSPYRHAFGSSFNISVESNGQTTLIPTLEGENDSGDSVEFNSLKWFSHGLKSSRDWRSINPATRLTMLICNQNVPDDNNDVHLHRFLDRIATLDWVGFTELEVARLAAQCNMLPMKRIHYWRGETPPPFTVELGSIGRVVEHNKHQSEWHVLDEGKSHNAKRTAQFMVCGTWDPLHYNYPTANDDWNSCPVCTCKGSVIDRPGLAHPSSWHEFTDQARLIASQTGIKLDEILYCALLFRTVRFYPPQPEETGSYGEVYFHSNPSSRSNLREYWGFLSTSPDPCAPELGSSPLGWRVVYDVELFCYCTTDGWDYRYQDMLRSALASIPGSFPSAQIEEFSGDES